MANNSPTLVMASLSDDQLKKSIDSLVTHVDEAMKKMVQSTNNAVGEMEAKLKSLGNLKIDSGGTNDGGAGRRTQQHEKLTKAVNDASEAVSKETQKLQDLQQSLSGASDREQNFISQKERAANTIAQENELLKQQEQELSNLKSQQSSFGGASQQTTASIEKQREVVANLKNEVKYWQSIVSQIQSGDKKTRFNSLWIGDTTSKQGHDILDVANKLYSIMQKLGMETEKGSASTGQAVKVVEQLAKYYKISREEAEKLVMSVQESPLARGKFTTHYDTRFGLDNLTMQKKDAEDSTLRLMIAQSKLERQTDDLALANKRLADSENSSTQSSQQKAQIDAQVAAKEKEIAETKGRIATATREQTEAERNASQAAREKANIQGQVANQEKQVAEAKKQLTTATQQQAEVEKQSVQNVVQQTAARDKQIKKNQEVATSFDQMAKAQQVAIRSASPSGIRNADTLQTMNIQLDLLRERLREARQQYSSFVALAAHATTTGDKGLFQYATDGVHRYEQEVRNLIPQIRTLQGGIQQMGDVIAPQGHTIQNYVNSLQKANPELAQLNEQFKRGQSLMQNGGLEAKKMSSAIINGSNQSKETIESLNKAVSQTIRIEQERRDAIRQTGIAAQEAFAKIRQNAQIQLAENTDKPIKGIKELADAITNMRRLYFDMSAAEKESPLGLALKRDIENAQKLKIAIDAYNRTLAGMPVLRTKVDANNSLGAYTELTNILKTLTDEYKRLGREERNAAKGNDLADKIQRLGREAQKIQQQMNSPISFAAAMKGDEKTLDDIAYKMQRLRSYKQGIDLTKPNAANEIKQVDEALARLQKDADKWMSKSQQMIKSNTALGRSWNYMKNRLAFYFTVGASTQFVKNLIEVRSQYEMNERALGILIDSAERGTQIFNELSQMALVSPYTLIELSTAAKQLTAYDVAAKDVVDTTRRLADMAAAVGIPIERLTYALGQIKAYGYLNSRDARMFANAGIPLVKQLSEYYTELEGRLVSTADVYDRIKKKAIDYNEVMEVINKMTDEGGKFFDFQAKMADTLKVRLANLTLAWNNMLNDIGKSSQGMLTWGIGALRELFLHWKQFSSAIYSAAWAGGLVIGLRALNVLLVKAGLNFRILSKDMTAAGIAGQGLATKMSALGKSIAALAKSSLTWWSLLAFAIVDAAKDLYYINEAQENLNKSIRDGAKDNYDNISKFLEQYKEVRDSLYSTEKVAIGSIYNTTTGKAELTAYAEQQVGQDIDKNEAKKAWEAIREQIELTSQSSDVYISKLLTIENVSERVRQGFNVLDDIQVVNAALKEVDEETIKMSTSLSAWWNLWSLPEGLIDNLEDYKNAVNDTENSWEKAGKTIASLLNPLALYTGGTNIIENYVKDSEDKLNDFREDLKVTTDSIVDFIELKGWSGDEGKINQVFEQITQKLILDNQLDPQKAFTLQTEVEEARSKAAKEALLQRINDEKAALKIANDDSVREALAADIERYKNWDETNGRSKVEWERFTKWLKEQHISETTAMFRNMDAEDIKSLNFQEGKHAEWVTRMVTQYAKEHKMSYDEAFGYLKNWVSSANQWSIFLPLIISTEDKKSVYDQLGEYDKAIDDADSQIARLTRRIGELRAKRNLDKKELQELVYAQQELTDAEKAKADAEAKGGHGKKETKDEKAAHKAAKQAESELAKALKEELSVIDKVRSIYKDLIKDGASYADAVERATAGWEETLNSINKVLVKNGLQKLDLTKFVGIDNPRELVMLLQTQLNKLVGRGAKPAEIKELQTKINTLLVDADKYDLTKITKGLNSELDKLKDEYELAVELDANPELGDMFADMFGINTSVLPRTFGDALDRAQTIINRKLAEMNITTPFDLIEGNIDSFAKSAGLDKDSALIKELVSAQNAYRDMFKKNITETEKILDDYIKKYGDYSDKIAEIEASRLEKLKKLNEAYYTEEMRKRPEYAAKLNAIEQGASREKQQVDFDEFKNSRYYTMMFENLDYISTKTIRDMRDRVRELMDTMNDLTPEQLKTLISQYEKLEQKLVKRSPFKTLTKDLKKYFATIKERRAANIEFKNAQKEYDIQKKSVATLKEKYEQAKANSNTSQSYLDFLRIEIDGENEILKILKEQLDAAQEKADKYNLTAKLAKSEALQVAQVVAVNLKGLAELRDQMNELFGVDASKGETLLGHKIDGLIDGLSKASDGISKITSSAQSGNVFGVIGGVVDTFVGIGDSIASIFGGGSAKTRRINREINESKESVRQLEMAYKDLERAVEKSLGTEETEARRAAIANKEAELAELERQMALEQSKRSKDRDDDAIKQYEEAAQDLRFQIEDLKDELVNNLFGEDVKSAAESFVDAWVQAWRAGETTLDAMKEKMDEMIFNLVKKALTSKIVEGLLTPLYKEIDKMTSEGSAGGMDITNEELFKLAQDAGITTEKINEALGAFYGNLENLGILSKTQEATSNLSALQQGLQSMSEETAGALEAYWNANTQQQYLQSDLLTQIRDTMVGWDFDVQLGAMSQILLQLQQSYQVQMSIESILQGVLVPSGRAFSVELLS